MKMVKVELFNLWTRHAELHIWSPEALCGFTDLFSPLSFDTHCALDLPMPRQILGFVLPFMCSFEYRVLYLLVSLIQSLRYMRASNNTLLPFHPVSPSLLISRTSAFSCGEKRKKIFKHFVGGHFNDL